MKINLHFQMSLDIEDIETIDDFGRDMAVFLEEYLNGQQKIDVHYCGHSL